MLQRPPKGAQGFERGKELRHASSPIRCKDVRIADIATVAGSRPDCPQGSNQILIEKHVSVRAAKRQILGALKGWEIAR
jgi:hypothetical protein